MRKDIQQAAVVSIGEGVDEEGFSLTGPIVFGTTVYTLDSRFVLQATDLKTGQQKWRKKLADIRGTSSKSVGLTIYRNSLYAVSGNGLIIATNLSGKEQWRKDLKVPLRSSPTADEGRLFVTSINNELFVLKTKDGQELWQYKGDKPTITNFFGVATPAVQGDIVVMPTTTGRVNAFDVETGVLLWAETLWKNKTYNTLLDMPQITSAPVIEGKAVFLVGNAGRSGLWQLETGMPIYTLPFGGRETPVISGNSIFLITNYNKLLCLNKQDGTLFWEKDLKELNKTADWFAPVLINNQVILTSSTGDILFLDAKTGLQKRQEKTNPLAKAPVLAKETMLLLTTQGNLLIYK
jgi:outer membrane protein assembly factor BamB